MDRFVIRTVDSGVKFDLKAANGQTVLTSEVYETIAACRRGIASVRKNAPGAKLEDQTAEGWKALSNPKYELPGQSRGLPFPAEGQKRSDHRYFRRLHKQGSLPCRH